MGLTLIYIAPALIPPSVVPITYVAVLMISLLVCLCALYNRVYILRSWA